MKIKKISKSTFQESNPLLNKLEQFKIIKTSLIILSILTLIYLIIPPLNQKFYPLKIGETASQDLIATEDFWVEDNVSTKEKMAQAENNILPIYDLNPDKLKLKISKTFHAFNMMQDLYKKYLPDFTFEKKEINESRLKKLEESILYTKQVEEFQKIIEFPLSEKSRKALKKYFYKPELRDQIIHFLKTFMEPGIVNNRELLELEDRKKITIRDLGSEKEREITDISSIYDLKQAQIMIKEAIKIEIEDEETQNLVTEFCENFLEPNLFYNEKEVVLRKKNAILDVEPVFFHVKKGEVIVRSGEKITERHLIKLNTLIKNKGYYNYRNVVLGITILVVLFLFLTWVYLSRFKSAFLTDKNLLLLGIILLINFAVIRVFMLISQALGNYIHYIEANTYLYATPYATGTMLVVILFGVEPGIVFSILTFLLVGLLNITQGGLSFPLMALGASLVAVFRMNQHKQRSGVIMTGLIIGVVNAIIITQFDLINNTLFSSKGFYDIIFCLFGGFTTAMFVSVSLPVLESGFKMTSDIRLLELADTNHPLISQLVTQSPGTYQHSYLTANLSEAAAEIVGVNPLLVRVGSYFHDIGKMKKSNYFIENQESSVNLHDKIPPSLSSLILISHVKDGIEMAKEYKLPPRIIDFIREHHGTCVIRYFYQKAKNREEPDIDLIDKEDFRYPGPKPQSKETAILLLADSVEAASRAMDNPTPPRLKNLVQEVINEKFVDGQLDECNLSLKELHLIADSFTHILLGCFHTRINYPVEKKQENGKSKTIFNDINQKSTKKNKDQDESDKKDLDEDIGNVRLLQ